MRVIRPTPGESVVVAQFAQNLTDDVRGSGTRDAELGCSDTGVVTEHLHTKDQLALAHAEALDEPGLKLGVAQVEGIGQTHVGVRVGDDRVEDLDHALTARALPRWARHVRNASMQRVVNTASMNVAPDGYRVTRSLTFLARYSCIALATSSRRTTGSPHELSRRTRRTSASVMKSSSGVVYLELDMFGFLCSTRMSGVGRVDVGGCRPPR